MTTYAVVLTSAASACVVYSSPDSEDAEAKARAWGGNVEVWDTKTGTRTLAIGNTPEFNGADPEFALKLQDGVRRYHQSVDTARYRDWYLVEN